MTQNTDTPEREQPTAYRLKELLSENDISNYTIEEGKTNGDVIIHLQRNEFSNNDGSINQDKLNNIMGDICKQLVMIGYEFDVEYDEGMPEITVNKKTNSRFRHPIVSQDPPKTIFSEEVINDKFAPIPPTSHITDSATFFPSHDPGHFGTKNTDYGPLEVVVGDVWYANNEDENGDENYYLITGFNVDQLVYYDLIEGKYFMTLNEAFEDMMYDDRKKNGLATLLPTPFATREQ